jgi:hypothetical protein
MAEERGDCNREIAGFFAMRQAMPAKPSAGGGGATAKGGSAHRDVA